MGQSPTPPAVDNPYSHNFTIHRYNGSIDEHNLARVDIVASGNAKEAATNAVLFGVCLMTLLHLVVLTPATKRRLPLFAFNVAALIFCIIRFLTGMLFLTESNLSKIYYMITPQAGNYGITAADEAVTVIMTIMAWPALLCTCACLYIQAKTVMSSMSRWLYWSIMSYLLLVTAFTALWRLIQIVYGIGYSWGNLPYDHKLDNVEQGSLALYCICFGSWSVVFILKVIFAIIARVRMGITKNTAMHILLMTSVESMVIPGMFQAHTDYPAISLLTIAAVLFLGLEYSGKVERHLARAELVAIPAVVCLIPFGSLWASSVQQNANAGWGYNTNSPANSDEKKPLVAARDVSPPYTGKQQSDGSGPSYQARASSSPDNTNNPSRAASDATERQLNRLYPELAEEDGIEVRHAYSVTSTPRSPSINHHASSMV